MYVLFIVHVESDFSAERFDTEAEAEAYTRGFFDASRSGPEAACIYLLNSKSDFESLVDSIGLEAVVKTLESNKIAPPEQTLP